MTSVRARSGGRAADELRPVTIEPGFVRTATGSALISCGGTRVICTASVQESVPRWMAGRGRGWMTAEYGMLPASTGERKPRDISKGKQDGRGIEIQRLIGRSLRGVTDLEALGERTVYDDAGSIPYSAVSQPRPLPSIQRGTDSWTDAVQITRVSPQEISAEPVAVRTKPGSISVGRIASGARSPARREPRPREPSTCSA